MLFWTISAKTAILQYQLLTIFPVWYSHYIPITKLALNHVQWILRSMQVHRCCTKLVPGFLDFNFINSSNYFSIILVLSIKADFVPWLCSDRYELETPGCNRHPHPARGRMCETCTRLKEGKTLGSSHTGRTYRIWNRFTGKSKFLAYLITCGRCSIQYVGIITNTMMGVAQ